MVILAAAVMNFQAYSHQTTAEDTMKQITDVCYAARMVAMDFRFVRCAIGHMRAPAAGRARIYAG